MIGKVPEDDGTFLGAVVLEADGNSLKGYRQIGTQKVPVTGQLEHPKCCEHMHILRLRFKHEGRDFEGTYLWQSDLDNYARLTGYVYEAGVRTQSPGLETLFIDHQQ